MWHFKLIQRKTKIMASTPIKRLIGPNPTIGDYNSKVEINFAYLAFLVTSRNIRYHWINIKRRVINKKKKTFYSTHTTQKPNQIDEPIYNLQNPNHASFNLRLKKIHEQHIRKHFANLVTLKIIMIQTNMGGRDGVSSIKIGRLRWVHVARVPDTSYSCHWKETTGGKR